MLLHEAVYDPSTFEYICSYRTGILSSLSRPSKEPSAAFDVDTGPSSFYLSIPVGLSLFSPLSSEC